MANKLAPLFSLLLITILTIGCGSAAISEPKLAGPEIAKQTASDTVALVTNFKSLDPAHSPFCTAVWVGQTTILTAAHCVKGYADMSHTVAVIEVLMDNGYSKEEAVLMVSFGLLEIDPSDPTLSEGLRKAVMLAATVPPAKPLGTVIPYTVQEDIVDNGVAPKALFAATATAFDSKEDLAVLRVKGPMPTHAFAQVADQTPEVGEIVYSIGHAMGGYYA